jgi:hypothetical protein
MTQTNTPAAKPTPRWYDWANRTTAVLAVLAALSSGSWGASNLQAILEQGKVNDTWAWYQADSIKAHGARQMAELVKTLNHDLPKERADEFKKTEDSFSNEAVSKEQDKTVRNNEALRFQKRRDRMVERGFWYEVSFALLQLGVILATIASAARKKGPWLLAILFGLLGLVALGNGFRQFVTAPQWFYQSTSEAIGGTEPAATK